MLLLLLKFTYPINNLFETMMRTYNPIHLELAAACAFLKHNFKMRMTAILMLELQ